MRKLERITDPDEINVKDILGLISEDYRVVIQFSRSGYSDEKLAELDRLLAEYHQQLEVRFYGHYREVFDARVIERIPHAHHLSLDCLTKASHLEALQSMEHLQHLSLGVYELDHFNVLSYESLRGLNSLNLGESKSKKLELKYLGQMLDLQNLGICKHTKDIEIVRQLPKLQCLALSRIPKTVNLSHINDMPALRKLEMTLGGRESIAELTGEHLEYIELCWIQGLRDLGDMSRFPMLKTLKVDRQKQIESVLFTNESSLEELFLLESKQLTQIHGIEYLKQLHQLRIYRTLIEYEKFIEQSLPDSLKILAFYTGKKKQDSVIEADLISRGYHLGSSRSL